MKKILVLCLAFFCLTALFACGDSESAEEQNARAILEDVQASIPGEDEKVDVTIEKVEMVKTQKDGNTEYGYFLVKTDSYDWGYAEICDGEVITYYVDYTKSVAKTRCNELASFRVSKFG